jgi:ABC-type antimicrobial peptide transport system permease subunit
MLRNILKISIRNLRKNSLYSVINISGLAIGIACSILILLLVNDELSFDNFIPKKDKLYQVWINGHYENTVHSWTSVPLPTYEAMKTAHHNIVNSAVAGWGYERLITYDEKKLLKDSYWVSKEFLVMFEFPFIKGDPTTAFNDPKSIVISESLAKELFDGEEAMDKMVRVNDESDVKVTGIFKDIPGNSSFQFDFLVPWEHRRQINEWVRDNEDNWGNNSFQVYIELSDSQYAGDVEASIKDMLTEKDPSDTWQRDFFIYPMERWRLYSDFEAGKESGGRIEYVQLFTAIGIAILLIACINFMNLATARSEKRAKEVGIRKSVGSRKRDLVMQFLGESIVISFVSFLIAIGLVLLVLPWFNDVVEKQLILDLTEPFFWILSGGIIFGTGLLAGSYPAFYLSSFNPVATLKGKMALGKGANLPRKVLVVLQFGVAIILMVGTIAIYQQINLVQERDLGYDKENLITVEFTEEIRNNYDALKAELLQSGAVESMTRSNGSVTQINSNNFLGWPGKPEETQVMFITVTGEYDYAKTMGVDVLMGRDFSKDYVSDTDAIVINKTALDLMDLDDPIGTELDLWGEKRPLIGVIDDVLMGSLYEENRPMFMILEDWGGVVTMRLKRGQDLQESLATVEDIVTKFNPAFPFDYSFVDVEFERKFTTIKLTRELAVSFSVLALIITSLGVFGLASFMAEQRTKEIGIRKVLGASVTSLVGLMSRDFSWLVILAFILAGPLSWFLMDAYLDRYTIRIDLQWWVMPLAGLVALVFAILIVSNQARRAALANPVNSLRSE